MKGGGGMAGSRHQRTGRIDCRLRAILGIEFTGIQCSKTNCSKLYRWKYDRLMKYCWEEVGKGMVGSLSFDHLEKEIHFCLIVFYVALCT